MHSLLVYETILNNPQINLYQLSKLLQENVATIKQQTDKLVEQGLITRKLYIDDLHNRTMQQHRTIEIGENMLKYTEQILTFIRANPGLNAYGIGKQLGLEASFVAYRAKTLETRGLIRREPSVIKGRQTWKIYPTASS